MKPNPRTTKKTLKIYWRYAKRYKMGMLKIYPTMAIAQFAEDFAIPLIVSSILTKLAAGKIDELSLDKIWPILLAVVLLELFAHLLWNYVVRTFWRWQEFVMRDLNMVAFDHLSSMSYRFFSNRFAGSLVNQVNKFCGSFERLTDALTWNVYKLAVGVVFTVLVLAPKAPLVVLAILFIATLYVPLIWIYRRQQLPYNIRWSAAETKRTGQLADAVSNILAVKSFANEKLERGLMRERVDEVYGRSMDTMKLNMRQELITGALQRSINVVVIILSVWLAVTGHIQAGVIYLALTYTAAILRRLWDLNNTFRTLTRVFGDAADMTEILQIEPEVKDPDTPEVPKIKSGAIEMINVGFDYPEKKKDAQFLRNFNLSIKSGEKVGLVGPSGGGKTTITKLLQRFMDIQDGEILIDGQDITHLKQDELRKYISYVPQEPLLFHRSLSDNIGYGQTDASEKHIKNAAKLAHADEFIQELPEKYETLVGERGVKLSGGQKQRVAIARAMVREAPILVLDEATSALDSESEKLIQDALWKLMEGRTSLVIAHRLSTIQHMDRIIVLDNGKIVEEGTHQDLVKSNGLYAKLWNHQTGGFLED
ncbi:MAG: ATP-binding cassette, subfamily bacterial [Patescibacteria group bacterium]|nr:ATP-binding cassette, subfamily bacterial [Patescibacteria group bacterium]